MANISILVGTKGSGKTAIILQQHHNLKKVFGDKIVLANCGSDKCETGLGVIQSAIEIARATSILLLKSTNEWAEIEYLIVDNAHLLTPLQVRELVVLADEYDVEIRLAGRKLNTDGQLFKGTAAIIEVCDSINHTSNAILCECGVSANYEIPDSNKLVCRKHFKDSRKPTNSLTFFRSQKY